MGYAFGVMRLGLCDMGYAIWVMRYALCNPGRG